MKRREWMKMLSLSLVGAGISRGEASSNQEIPERELLSVGDSRRYDSGLKVTFLRVSRDNRCPADEECEKPGNATIILRIKAGKKRAKNYKLQTRKKPKKLVIPVKITSQGKKKSFVLKIASLSPLPIEGKTTPAEDYQLDLKVSLKG